MFVVNYLRSFFSSSGQSPSDSGGGTHSQRESISFWTLNVTVLRATNKNSMTQSDLFVTLSLPTATTRIYRTKTVANQNNPDYNESFTFRFPIQVKNILEISLADPQQTELTYTGFLDISTLLVGEKETRTFITNQQTNDELVIEFELVKSDEVNDAYHTNGIVVAAPITALNVGVKKLLNNFSVDEMLLKIVGSYQGTQSLDQTESENLRFYINRDLETEIGLIPKQAAEGASPAQMETSSQLDPLPADHSGKVSLEMGEDVVDLDVDTNEHPNKEPNVRIDFDIPPEEKEFLRKRKVVVAEALQKLFRFGLKPEQVPTIAVVASGGGSRAMTGLLGGLRALKEIGVLDTVTYITGVSGSTWTMSALYQDTDWSKKDIDSFIAAEKVQLTKAATSAITPAKILYYLEELKAKHTEGHMVSLTDVAALLFEHLIFGKKMTGTLSEQRKTVSDGQNPFPIYNAVNTKEEFPEAEAEWCEFTPYEIGLLKYGTFIPTEDFGSHFFLGHCLKKLPEIRLPYLIGIWSSAFAVNFTEVWKSVTGRDPPWIIHNESDESPSMDTTIMTPVSDAADKLTHFLRTRIGATKICNYMRGFFLHWDYSKHPNFAAWKDNHPDAFPNQLTPSDCTLELVDSGHSINIGCAPVLRPERNVDIIIVLSYSWDPDHILNVIQLTTEYCQDHQIPFPNVDFSIMEEEPEEIYVFEDEENPKAPVVIHFPLVNITYREFIRPGVKRETEEEKKAGDVDVSSETSPFKTIHLNYTEEEYDSLVNLAYYNVVNNTERVHKVIWKVVQGKRESGWCNLQ